MTEHQYRELRSSERYMELLENAIGAIDSLTDNFDFNEIGDDIIYQAHGRMTLLFNSAKEYHMKLIRNLDNAN